MVLSHYVGNDFDRMLITILFENLCWDKAMKHVLRFANSPYQAPCECPSANPQYISLYYKYRMCERGSVLLDSDNEAILDVITHKPIRCVGTWKSYSSTEKLNSALRKAHDCIDQSTNKPIQMGLFGLIVCDSLRQLDSHLIFIK